MKIKILLLLIVFIIKQSFSFIQKNEGSDLISQDLFEKDDFVKRLLQKKRTNLSVSNETKKVLAYLFDASKETLPKQVFNGAVDVKIKQVGPKIGIFKIEDSVKNQKPSIQGDKDLPILYHLLDTNDSNLISTGPITSTNSTTNYTDPEEAVVSKNVNLSESINLPGNFNILSESVKKVQEKIDQSNQAAIGNQLTLEQHRDTIESLNQGVIRTLIEIPVSIRKLLSSLKQPGYPKRTFFNPHTNTILSEIQLCLNDRCGPPNNDPQPISHPIHQIFEPGVHVNIPKFLSQWSKPDSLISTLY